MEKRFSDFAELDAQLDEAFKSDDSIVVSTKEASVVSAPVACRLLVLFSTHRTNLILTALTQLPEFPPKKYFGSLSPALIKERQEALEKYMKALVKDAEVGFLRHHLSPSPPEAAPSSLPSSARFILLALAESLHGRS
eukprot:747845-Hanusia_phi.AAC.2